MDLHYQKEITVGTLVLAGIGLFVAGTLWLKGSTIRSPARESGGRSKCQESEEHNEGP